jgi:hypothetical protein
VLVVGDLVELREVAFEQHKKIKKKFIFIFYFFIFPSLGLSPANVCGVKPWEPPV